MPKISIILPVYNVENYITKSIQSVLNQTYENFELLVIDDGSPDKSMEAAEQFEDARIKVFHKKNGGLSDARNFGLERALGEYIYFMDSDDWIEPTLLAFSLEAIEKFECDFIIFGYHLDRESLKGDLLSTKAIKHESTVFIKEENNLNFKDNTLGLLGYAWNKFYKTSFLNNNSLRFIKGISLVEDILFNTKVYGLTNKIVFIENALYHYIDRPATSLIKTFHKNSFELKVRRNLAINGFLREWQTEESLKREVLAHSIVSGIRYCVNNLFAFKNNLSFKEKLNYLNEMLHHEETIKYIDFYTPIAAQDKVYKMLIRSRAVYPLYILCKIKK